MKHYLLLADIHYETLFVISLHSFLQPQQTRVQLEDRELGQWGYKQGPF